MTTAQAKKDAYTKLTDAGIAFHSIGGKSVCFEGLGYGSALFISVKGIDFQGLGVLDKWDAIKATIPKPSQGGYILKAI